MKRLLAAAALTAAMAITGACTSTEELARDFATPPETVQTGIYWYWISGNISEEGVVRDLHAMKRAGINRAFIGNIGQDGLYTERNVLMMSDEWWKILHTALKTASELDIEIGIFNSPGWSQSGGPWVKPDEAMRYLASAQIEVEGPRHIETKIEAPAADFEDVRTIAYPAPEEYASRPDAAIKTDFGADNAAAIADGDPATGITLPAGRVNTITFDCGKPYTARSLTLKLLPSPAAYGARLEAEIDGTYTTVATFTVDRSNPAINVGFDPYAPVTVSFAATTARRFRLVTDAAAQSGGIAEAELSAQPRIASYAEKTLAKMCQTPLPYWNHYMWPVQAEIDNKAYAIDPASVQDISASIDSEGNLKWDVPEGRWIIMRTGMAPTGVTNGPATPEATGLEIDKMSSRHVRTHFDAFIGEILRRIPAEDRKTFKVVVQDSYETGGQNFTDDFMQTFESVYGYSMLPYLPAYYGYVVGDQDRSDRFLWDLRRLIADQVAYQYVGGLRDVSHEHGLTTWLECYGHWGFPGEFLQYGGQSDEIAGEFWSAGSLGDIENRAASSCGHIYGKTLIWAESNTSGGPAYSRAPVDMKQRTDRFFAEGINASLLHLYIEQADTLRYPGINAPFGNEFDANNTWFSQMDLFTDYLKRCNYMLRQGLNVADVAYLIGEDAPKMTGEQSPALPAGYQFDYINAEVIMRDANVSHGRITLPHGTSYRVLVLPPVETMRPELLEKIERMVSDGAILLGQPPRRSPSMQNYPAADAEVERMARSMWGGCFDTKGANDYGKGRIYNGCSLEEIFAEIDLEPDFRVESGAPLLYNHRSMMGAEIYFVSNQSGAAVDATPEFRVDPTLAPERWNPVDGSITSLPQFEATATGIRMPLHLEPLESCFIVFRGKGSPKAGDNNPTPASAVEISEPWHVAFDGKLSSPAPIEMASPADLAQNADPEIRYFSGTITYTTEFDLDDASAARVLLNLGRVESMAKVYVNDRYAGGAWCPPYKVDITQCVKKGRNTLRVEVVNKWVNRIVGDMQLPPEQRKISLLVNPYDASTPLPPSGLQQAVTVETYE
ncbi:MAG: glycoside hydrolase family 2 [Bacteroidales bacterium]|nr:MAG: glycoside hydrolase family 2 [Bacteroidales bacterium]